MSTERPKQVNVNTLLIVLLNLLLAVVAFFLKHELEVIESAQSKMWQAMMPRVEIEAKILDIKERESQSDAALEVLRARITAVEIENAKRH